MNCLLLIIVDVGDLKERQYLDQFFKTVNTDIKK